VLRRRAPRSVEDARMSLADHLQELRRRLAIALLALFVVTIVTFVVLYHPVFDVLSHPYCKLPASRRLGGGHCDLIVTGPTDAFFVRLHVSVIVGAILSSPVWLYQLWAFITPGLHRHERRYAVAFVGTSVVLFALGGLTAYLSLSKGLEVLLGFATGNITPLITVDRYLSFVTAMLLVFGVSFEFPLFVVMLNLAGVVSYERLKRWRRMEIFLVTCFAAVATPSQDPFTMLALAAPLWLLYEGALLVARVHDGRVARRPSPYADLADDELSPLDVDHDPLGSPP
jgi:sec-independent protein translocase protein TatC